MAQVITGVGKRGGGGWSFTPRGKGGHFRLDGIENVTNTINAHLKMMTHKSEAGLILAAKWVLNDADSGTSPLVPEDTGKLRGSRFQHPIKTAGDPAVLLGYNAGYAAAVHEMMQSSSGVPINWSRPGSGPKFLEASLKRNTQKVLQIVQSTL